jgi:branched-chain amino acid transport system ATP-binding protein
MSAQAAFRGKVEARGVVAGYDTAHHVLRGVSLVAQPGRVTVVLGPNGAGKSTVLRVLSGLLPPAQGTVLLDGEDITAVPPHHRLRLGIAFLPQGRSVFPELTVHENLELGGWIFGADRARLRRALDATYGRYPQLAAWRQKLAGSLSGGQQRLVEIARLLVADPRVLLVDEPGAGLAPGIATQVYEELAALCREGRTVLLVDQNVQAALALANYVYTLESGRNQLSGTPADFDVASLVRGWLRVPAGPGGAP